MKQTNQYKLNLIETGDPFSPDPINENTQTLESTLIGHTADSTAHQDIRAEIQNHTGSKSNPHGVTAAQVGAAAASHNHSAANITSGTLGVANGGTGAATAQNACNAFLNALSTGVDAPKDADYYISQYSNGGTTHTTYHRRPVSALWTYIKGKADSVYAALSHNHSAANITSGTLPVARGGTGNTAADTTPTSGSTKMVTSGGIYTALSQKFGPGNTGWVTGTYTGTGVVNTAKAIDLGFQPSAVVITRVGTDSTITGFAICIRSGSSQGSLSSADKPLSHSFNFYNTYCSITSTGFSVVKPHSSYNYGLNESGATYVYLAFK